MSQSTNVNIPGLNLLQGNLVATYLTSPFCYFDFKVYKVSRIFQSYDLGKLLYFLSIQLGPSLLSDLEEIRDQP